MAETQEKRFVIWGDQGEIGRFDNIIQVIDQCKILIKDIPGETNKRIAISKLKIDDNLKLSTLGTAKLYHHLGL